MNSPTSTEESRPVMNVQAYLMTMSSKSMTSVNRHTPIRSIKFPDLANTLLNTLHISRLGAETHCIPHRNDFGTAMDQRSWRRTVVRLGADRAKGTSHIYSALHIHSSGCLHV